VCAARLAAALACLLPFPPPVWARPPLQDAPVAWYDDDRRDIPMPGERDPNLAWDAAYESFFRPVGRTFEPSRRIRRLGALFGGDHVTPAANVNALDEAPNSSWFTNRIGLFPMTAEDVGRGSGSGLGPDPSAVWRIVRAKTEGVTPGFTIEDARGERYLIKFDPPELPGMSSGAGVISNRLLHAAGYNVPDDTIVYFTRDRLALGEGVTLALPGGARRDMTAADVDAMLSRVTSRDGEWRALASKLLPGKPIGPFDYAGRRDDDPNDRVDHEDRRELRGLHVIAAWLAHFDTKQHNSLDMYVEEDGRRFVRHHLIDFASTLGAGAQGPMYRANFEYTVDPLPVLGRWLALGFHEDAWRRLARPKGLAEVGTFESEVFDPREFKPLHPNPAFANVTTRDAYWAAKIVSAFTDEQLVGACEQARYEDPAATAYVARILAERRDKIARCWFDETPPLDYFAVAGGVVRFRDLGHERGIYPGTTPRYRVRLAAATAGRRADRWTDWIVTAAPEVDTRVPQVARAIDGSASDAHPFLALECQVDRGRGWSGSVTAYVARRSGRVAGVDR
jgi:hypothetical protein